MNALQIILFLIANGNRIVDISEKLIAEVRQFVEELLAEYSDKAGIMSAGMFEEAADKYAEKYPHVLASCERMALCDANGNARIAAVGVRGRFLDVIKYIIENGDSILDLIDKVVGLFPNEAAPETTPPVE